MHGRHAGRLPPAPEKAGGRRAVALPSPAAARLLHSTQWRTQPCASAFSLHPGLDHAKRTQHRPDAVPDQRGRPRQAAAAVPVRQDQRPEIPETPGRRRRHRPGHGQPHRRARPAGHRQALRGGPRRAQPPLLRQQRPATTSAARSPSATPGCTASSSTPTPKSWPASAPRKSSATCAWPCSAPATRPSCRRRRSPSTSTPSPWPRATSSASTARSPTASCPTSPTWRSIFIRGPRC